MAILLDNVNAPTTSVPFDGTGGPVFLIIRGDDYTGVTVTLELASKSDPNDPDRWATIAGASFTADDFFSIPHLPVGAMIRAVAAGASAGDNIFVEVL